MKKWGGKLTKLLSRVSHKKKILGIRKCNSVENDDPVTIRNSFNTFLTTIAIKKLTKNIKGTTQHR